MRAMFFLIIFFICKFSWAEDNPSTNKYWVEKNGGICVKAVVDILCERNSWNKETVYTLIKNKIDELQTAYEQEV